MAGIPQVPSDLTVEINIGGTWTNVTSYVMGRDPVTIIRGSSDEATQTEPSSMTASLNNRGGQFSPRNPMSPYFGLLGRNTPIRAHVNRGGLALDMPGGAGDEATAPDSTSLSITGDIDVRIDLTMPSWSGINLCGKYATTADQRSWLFQIGPDGRPVFSWSSDGTSTEEIIALAGQPPLPTGPARRALRATLDIGASTVVAAFYTADSIDGTWTQLGDSVTGAFTTSIFDGTAPVEVGDVADATLINAFDTTASPVRGRIHAFELRDGIDGTLVASPDFTAQTAGDTSFGDAESNTWTLAGDASITNRAWLFHGELSSLPPRWDISGTDVWVPIVAGGLMRRLGQGSSPLRSTIYRGVLADDTVVTYWPCEDGADATTIAPSTAFGGQPMTISGSPNLSSSDVFVASESLPTIANSTWAGQVANYVPGTQAQVRFLLALPADGATNNAVIARIYTTGPAARWDIIYTTTSSGSLTFAAFDDENNSLLAAGGFAASGYNGGHVRMSLQLTQSGSDIDVELAVLKVGEGTAVSLQDTISATRFDRVKTVVIDPNGNLDDVTLGHISVHSAITDIDDLADELTGYAGEAAGTRISRLCTEEGITLRSIGDLTSTVAMGVQRPGDLLDLLRECADADLGILYEPRDVIGLGYRSRETLYNQTSQVVIDYASHELSQAPEPTDDDQALRNDVTVTRTGGSSARYEVTDGPLSVDDPPDGAGRYETQQTINIEQDGLLLHQAAWRAHLGTIDEARYPQIPLAYHAEELVANATLTRQLLDAEVGDRLTVTNPPDWLPQQDIVQLIQGSTETLTNFEHSLILNTAPASPYEIAVAGTDRFDTAGSELAAASDQVSTTLSVTTTLGPAWTTDSDDMPFDVNVGGEQVTVTAIATAAAQQQTFTVTRSVNGVTKTHDTGTDVRLWKPKYREM